MIDPKTLQIQAVLYKNQKSALERSLWSLANAARAAGQDASLGAVTLLWGDASPEPIYTPEEISDLNARVQKEYGNAFSVNYRFFDENTGYGKGHNRLFEDCPADYLLILNPDIVVCYDFFAEMLAPFADPDVGLTEARQTPVEHPKCYDEHTGVTPWASGACFIMPTPLYRELGGFDEQFFMYCEDVDLSFRIRERGKKLIYRPTAAVYHGKRFDNRSGELERTVTEMRFSVESLLILAYKWHQKKQLSYLRSIYQSGDQYQQAGLAAFEERLKKGELTRFTGKRSVFKQRYLKNRYTM